MNKKLLTLAVAAAVAAPSAAMAEAVLYGKLHQSIDYVEINNATLPDTGTTYRVIPPVTGESGSYNLVGTYGPTDVDGWPKDWESNNLPLTADQLAEVPLVGTVYPVDANGNVIANNADGVPTPGITGQDFDGWGISANSWRRFTTVNALTGIASPVNDRANRIGVKGSEDLGNGLKAIYQVEFGINLNSADNNIPGGNNGISYRNSFVGLAGDWGTALVGRHDTPLKISTGKLDLFSDTMADYNGTIGFNDLRTDNTVAYISPSFSGFSFMGAMIAGGGASAGEGLNYENTSLASAYSLALIYNNGPFYGSAAYEVLSNEMFMDGDTSSAGSSACVNPDGSATLTCGYVDDDFSKWRLGLGILDWNGFTLTAIYEQQDDLPGGQVREAFATVDPDGNTNIFGSTGVKKQELWQVQAGYSFGNNMVKAMYGSVDRNNAKAFGSTRETLSVRNIRDDLEGDRSAWAVGVDHNFSKRTKVYALYTAVDDDYEDNLLVQGADWSGFSLGLIHKF